MRDLILSVLLAFFLVSGAALGASGLKDISEAGRLCNQETHLGSYRVSLLANINFHSPDDAVVTRKLNSILTYPQGFFIDEDAGELFIVRYSNTTPTKAVLEVYGWPDFKYKRMFYLEGTEGTISEGLVIRAEAGVRYAFVRSGDTLGKYKIPAAGNSGDIISGQKTGIKNLAQSFSYYDGRWYVENVRSRWVDKGFSRGDYTVHDDDYKEIGSVKFEPDLAGFKESANLGVQKHQGFFRFKDGFVMSLGGFWKSGSKITPYHREGIEMFDLSGKCVSSYTFSPQNLVNALRDKGVVADRIENEGVQVISNGDFVLMNVVQVFRRPVGGLLFLKISSSKTESGILQLKNLEK